MKIIVIGWMSPFSAGAGIVSALKYAGHEVRTIATDTSTTRKNLLFCDLYLRDFLTIEQIERKDRIRLKDSLFKLIQNDNILYDFVLIIQSNICFDISGITIPIYYYHRNLLYKHIPLYGNIQGLFYAYVKGYQNLAMIYPPEINAMKIHQFLPYAIDSHHLPSFTLGESFNYFLGFQGALDVQNGDMNDPLMDFVYSNRKRFIDFARTLNAEIRERDNPVDQVNWLQFMRRCNLSLNIPGNFGGVNERQFYIPACRSVLLQWYYPELELMNFFNRKNCLTFHTEKELEEQCRWAFFNPQELNIIREAGYQLVLQSHTWDNRVEVILETVKKTL